LFAFGFTERYNLYKNIHYLSIFIGLKKMNRYLPYLQHLEQLLLRCLNGNPIRKSQLNASLDGEPSRELRRLVDLDVQKSSGAFFTGKKLALKASLFVRPINNRSKVLDPCCGAGDLLLAYARHLPVANDLKTTLDLWEPLIYGFDVHPEFVKAARIRLLLLAMHRCQTVGDFDEKIINKVFGNIKVGNSLLTLDSIRKCDNIIINPPYSPIKAPKECTWAKGNVSSAAVFMDKCISVATDKSKISAILPDVLRTGSRYSRWRKHISSLAKIEKVTIIGQFDKWADVDVFLLNLSVKKNSDNKTSWAIPQINKNATRIKDLFFVNVGAVVPHRDEEIGPLSPYISSKLLPKKGACSKFSHFRRFSGKLFEPPFVAIRRTSRPGDKHRITANLVTGNKPVAVENHLLVLSPIDKTLLSCRKLIYNLKANKTNSWLDKRIRCRHLTVSAIQELTFKEGEDD